jgi:hypothetical protein
MSNVVKIRLVGAGLFHVDRRTKRQRKRSKYFPFVILRTRLKMPIRKFCVNMEIIDICPHIHTKHTNTLYGQNVELLNVKLAVYKSPVRTAQ